MQRYLADCGWRALLAGALALSAASWTARAGTVGYGYNELGRVTCVSPADSSQITFAYDSPGNRGSQTIVAAGGACPPSTSNAQTPVTNPVSASVAYGSTNDLIALNITRGVPASVAVSTAAGHGTTVINGASISYTPNSGYLGSDSFQYTATNSAGTSSPATATLSVGSQTPIAGPVTTTVAYGSSNDPIPLNITGGTATSVTVSSPAANGTASPSGTSINYTPTNGYWGADSFQYTATNSSGTSAPATASITVSTPSPPVANDDTASTGFNSAANIFVLANDTDPNGFTLYLSSPGTPSHGTTSLGSNYITYTPNSGYIGADQFTYKINDAHGNFASANVYVTVNPPPPPVASNVSPTVTENTASPIGLSISGGTPTSVAVVAGSGPSHGTTSVSGTSINYTPTTGYTGMDSFQYTASNAGGTSAAASVNITVSPNSTPHVSPTPVWRNISNGMAHVPVTGSNPAQTIQGINVTITLQFNVTVMDSGTVQYLYSKNSGVWTAFTSGTTITVVNGDTLAFEVSKITSNGEVTGTISVINESDSNTQLGQFTYDVEAGNQ